MIQIAHRGYSEKFGDNTIEAFKQAIKENFDIIELDIQLAKDNEIVIYHDIEKNNNYINEYTSKELEKYNILSLKQFLNRINIDEINFFFDIKGNFKIIYPLIDIIKRDFKYDQIKNIYISGFDRTYIDILNSYNLPLKIGFTTSNNFTIDEIKILTKSIHFVCFDWNVLNNQIL